MKGQDVNVFIKEALIPDPIKYDLDMVSSKTVVAT